MRNAEKPQPLGIIGFGDFGAGEGNRKHPPRFFNFHQNTPKTAYLLRIIEVGGLGQQEPISHANAPNRKKVVSNCQQNREGLREYRP
ncbi:MAG TPA: hypothetical protein P5555_20350 [Candidatus Paceibacterota bacterium]|nr:hypothetical protein [Verrucomicrobiota bacterium]HRZ47534.1 hypothetical protein [Candidatus Paceibacterota bacterium]HRZ54812.1 hypothetical protein [Candidatus Paceibacterota bacterium]